MDFKGSTKLRPRMCDELVEELCMLCSETDFTMSEFINKLVAEHPSINSVVPSLAKETTYDISTL